MTGITESFGIDGTRLSFKELLIDAEPQTAGKTLRQICWRRFDAGLTTLKSRCLTTKRVYPQVSAITKYLPQGEHKKRHALSFPSGRGESRG